MTGRTTAKTTDSKVFEAVFFDFDGVLVESIDIKTDAFRDLYAEHGPDVVSKVVAHHLENTGIARSIKIFDAHRLFLGITLDADATTELAARYSAMVEDKVISCNWVPGARKLLDRLAKEKVPLFIVSGTPQDELKRIVYARGMGHYFTSVHGSPRKKTDILGDLLKTHGFAPSNTLMIGDGLTDMRAAQAVGVEFLGRLRPDGLNSFPQDVKTVTDLAL